MQEDVFGKGDYSAGRLDRQVIIISAKNIDLPSLQAKAELRRMPWRCWPPVYGLFLNNPSIFSPTVSEGYAVIVDAYPDGFDYVDIIDAAGRQHVTLSQGVTSVNREAPSELPIYAVFQMVGNHSDCIVAPYDQLMPAVYFNATLHLGPMKHADATTWMSTNCDR
jgi:hypothetical protein